MESRRRIAEFFSTFRQEMACEAAADVEPAPRFTPNWEAWLMRDLKRRHRRHQIDESEALSSAPDDPAPFASEGLLVFLEWSGRQERRRRAHRSRA